MRVFIVLFGAFSLAGCATYQPTFPSTEGAESQSLHILPVLHQEEMEVQVIVADSSAATGQYGAIGALIGAIVDSAITNSRAKQAERKAEVLREATADYDLVNNLRTAVAVESPGDGWTVDDIGDVTAETEIREAVGQIFADSDVDTVMVLSGTYQLTPTVDQVSVWIHQQVFPRARLVDGKRPTPSGSRYLVYQSPLHAPVYRPFADGEKELLKAAIERQYEQAIATGSEDEETLRKALASELEEIDAATEITEEIAIAETWTSELLTTYLDEAKNHLRFMLEHDWNERVKPEMDTASLEEFHTVLGTGVATKYKGYRVGDLDGNVVYRTAGGTIYSVPVADQ